MLESDKFMAFAIQLAKQADKCVKINPYVGCVIVANGVIIGQGCHKIYGEQHAEINAIESIPTDKRHLLKGSDVYVTLEPCCHFGNTPPCANRLVDEGVKRVFIGSLDPNEKVHSKGISILRSNGIEVRTGVLEEQCDQLLDAFKLHLEKKAFITLKMAMSKDGFMGSTAERIYISSEAAQVVSHQLRSNVDAIMIGHNTLKIDNPNLTTRLIEGDNPIRLVVGNVSKDKSFAAFNDDAPTIIVEPSKLDDPNAFLTWLYAEGYFRVLVEGGAMLLNYFIKNGIWHQAMLVQHHSLMLGENSSLVKAPHITGRMISKYNTHQESITTIQKTI